MSVTYPDENIDFCKELAKMEDLTSFRRNFINRYLDSPILRFNQERTLAELLRLKDIKKESRKGEMKGVSRATKAIEAFLPDDCDIQGYNPHDLSAIIESFPSSGQHTGITKATQIASKLWADASSSFSKITGCGSIQSFPDDVGPDARLYLNKALLLCRFEERLTGSRLVGGVNAVREESCGITIIGDQYSCCLYYKEDNLAYIMSYEVILMMKDMCLSRHNVFVACTVVYGGSYELIKAVRAVLKWCEECLYVYGNKGYEILKNLEALSKTYIIRRTDKILGVGGSYKRMKALITAKEVAMGGVAPFMPDRLESIFDDVSKTEHLVELFGLMKLTGHPLLDPREGGESAAQEASMPRDTTMESVQRLRNNWCRMYVEGYVSKEQDWPRLIFPPASRGTRLFQLYSTREKKLSRSSYPLSDWTGVRFEKHCEFDYYTNFTDLMDDKSLSFYRSDFRATWDKGVKPKSHKRLLMEMLSRPEVSIKQIIDLVESGDIPSDWLIVSLYPKEREFKLKARMFSMMVFEMRVFFNCLEANLAEKIFPMLPQQTMTLTKLEIQTRFFRLSRTGKGSNVWKAFLEIDLSRWNLRWRDLPIRLIGEDLNDIFGMRRAYTVVHEFFASALIVVRVNDYPPPGFEEPNPRTSSLLWKDHEGGFEGISQKHWTLATYSMVDLGLQGFNVKDALLGQADNQVVLLDIYGVPEDSPEEYIRDLVGRMKSAIADECARVGQDAKPEECVESTEVITYSKDFYISGSEYHLSLKALSRVFPHGSSDFPTIVNAIASLASACTSAAEHLKQPVLGYYLFLYHAALYLVSLRTRILPEAVHMSKRLKAKLDTEMITRLLSLPGSLGGLPIVGFMHFVFKGGADPLMKEYESLYLLSTSFDSFAQRVNHALLTGLWYPESPDRTLLLADPYSLPIRKAALAENRIQSISQQAIFQIAKNRDIKELMSADVDDFRTQLAQILLDCRPFNPVLFGDIVKSSIAGAQDVVSKMFSTTRTIMSLVVEDGTDPGNLIMSASVEGLRDAVSRITDLPANKKPFRNLYDSVERMRSFWGSEGERPVGLTSTSVLDWKIHHNAEAVGKQGIRVIFPGAMDSQFLAGKEEPYLGAATREKRTSYGYKIVISSSADKAVARLHRIMSQPGVGDGFKRFLSEVAQSRTYTDLLQLESRLSKSEGGTLIHRYVEISGQRASSILGCGTFATHAVLDSDNAGYLSASKNDYPVMFQSYLVAGLSILNIKARSNPREPAWLCFEVPPGIPELPDETVEVAPYEPLTIPQFPTNAVAFTMDLTLIKEVTPATTEMLTPLTAGEAESLDGEVLAACYVLRVFLARRSAYAVADLGSGSISIKLDLLEFRGLGSRNIVNGAAIAIAQVAHQALFERASGSIRWSPLPVITTLAAAITPSLYRAFSHPVFNSDPYAAEIAPRSSLSYTRGAALKTLQVRIGNLAHKLTTDIGSKALAPEGLLFADDKESSTPSLMGAIMHRILLGSTGRGEITAELCYTLARRHMVVALRGAATAQLKTAALLRVAYVLIDWATQQGLDYLPSQMRRLVGGRCMRIAPTTLTSELRLARARIAVDDVIERITLNSSYEGWDIATLSQRLLEANDLVIPSLGDMKTYDPDYTRFSLMRRSLRVYGMEAAAVSSFECLGSFFTDHVVYVLGCGHGGAAAVACLHKALTVVGHDLMSDLDPIYWAKDDSGPPILQRLGQSSKFTRSRAGYARAKGSILMEETWKELANYCPAGTVIVIDVPLSGVGDLKNILRWACQHLHGAIMTIRILCISADNTALLGTLSRSGLLLAVHTVHESYGYNEIQIVIRVERYRQLLAARFVEDVSHPATVIAEETMSKYGGGTQHNRERILGDFLTLALEDYDVEDEMWGSLALAPMTREDHSFTYEQWTRATLALCFRYLDGLTLREYIELMVMWKSSDLVAFTVGGVDRTLTLTPQVRAVLMQEYPRCRLPEK